jgi:hypothetical protein
MSTSKDYIDEQINKAANEILYLSNRLQRPIVISIDGGSGAENPQLPNNYASNYKL